jgi:hypothetical protein
MCLLDFDRVLVGASTVSIYEVWQFENWLYKELIDERLKWQKICVSGHSLCEHVHNTAVISCP